MNFKMIALGLTTLVLTACGTHTPPEPKTQEASFVVKRVSFASNVDLNIITLNKEIHEKGLTAVLDSYKTPYTLDNLGYQTLAVNQEKVYTNVVPVEYVSGITKTTINNTTTKTTRSFIPEGTYAKLHLVGFKKDEAIVYMRIEDTEIKRIDKTNTGLDLPYTQKLNSGNSVSLKPHESKVAYYGHYNNDDDKEHFTVLVYIERE